MLTYRPVSIFDAKLLFEWRNDVTTRAMSRHPDPIEWSEHIGWLERRLSRENADLYIVQNGAHPIGTFRIDGDEISYTVAPNMRQLGYATMMLKLAKAEFGSKRAEIFRRNLASIKAAHRAGHIVVLLD